jgi:hypothetical protein
LRGVLPGFSTWSFCTTGPAAPPITCESSRRGRIPTGRARTLTGLLSQLHAIAVHRWHRIGGGRGATDISVGASSVPAYPVPASEL